MLIERRAYTLSPGNTAAFWQAQQMRGLDPSTRPIMARVIGWFETCSGPQPQIVHLWRYDDFDDWHDRLLGPNPAAEPYYRAVRPLMLAQENRFMRPAPVPGLTPLWGNGNDWLPGGPVQADLAHEPDLLIEETMTTMRPGALPPYWEACRALDREAPEQSRAHLLGAFYTLVGRQHQVLVYRRYPDFAERERHAAERRSARAWRAFVDATRPGVVGEETLLLRPSPVAATTPLFRYPAPEPGPGPATPSPER